MAIALQLADGLFHGAADAGSAIAIFLLAGAALGAAGGALAGGALAGGGRAPAA